MRRRSMAEQKAMYAKGSGFPQLKCVVRIARIPFIDSGLSAVAGIYTAIKTSNPVFHWGLDLTENSVIAVLDHTKPAVAIFNSPISMIDALLCKSLDLVEEKVPVVTLPPELIYVSTKDYVSNAFVRPVLERADSMKQFGLSRANTVLASKYTQYAAHQLDSALDIADKYVDQYLPADVADGPAPDETDGAVDGASGSEAAHAIHHVDKFSRKLQRRLTRRTIQEAKALKKQSVDAIQFMINMAELLAKDPKAAMEKAAILWAHLSEDEPENQARPQNLEQLTVMVSREMARRVVHLVNYTRLNVSTLPRNVRRTVNKAVAAFTQLADTVVKRTHLEGVTSFAITRTKDQAAKVHTLISSLNTFTTQLLERIASNIAGKPAVRPHTNGSANNHRATNNILHNSFE